MSGPSHSFYRLGLRLHGWASDFGLFLWSLSIPVTLSAWPVTPGPYTFLHFADETRRGEATEDALGCVHRNAEPLLQRADRQSDAGILNDSVDDPLHHRRAAGDISAFFPHGRVPPWIQGGNRSAVFPYRRDRQAGMGNRRSGLGFCYSFLAPDLRSSIRADKRQTKPKFAFQEQQIHRELHQHRSS